MLILNNIQQNIINKAEDFFLPYFFYKTTQTYIFLKKITF